MTSNTYNGWTNWATWNVNLWIDNEEGTYRAKQQFLRRASTINAYTVAEFCRDVLTAFYGREHTPDMEPRDMANVDWEQIAEHFIVERDELLKE
jgi:hypothetical protein